MNDLISRQDIEWHHYLVADGNGMYHDEKVAYKSQIDDLPSAQPEPQWILCSERLPEDDDWQILTILDEHGDTPYRYSDFGWYLDKAECWIIAAEQRTDVIAWMPLPEPYKE